MYGSFDFSVRQYIIRDPEVYKRLTIKDFEYFEDHRAFVNEKVDKLLGNNIFMMHGEKWRQMRATLSPAFTGSKMRQMFDLVTDCTDDVIQHFSNKSKNGEKIDIEMKDFCSRYANDVIASCAFGVKVNSFDDPDNEFYSKATEFMKFWSFKKLLTIITTILMPKIANILGLRIFDETITNSFKNIVLSTMETRKRLNIVRPDMINIMIQVRDGSLKYQNEENSSEIVEGFATVQESEVGKMAITRKWNDDEIFAQCFGFFFGGFDTTSTALTFTAYEVAVNPNIQQKLYEEIVEMNKQLDGEKISYNELQKMKYMDQVICETLRKWPSGVPTDRICVKDYVYDDGQLKFNIEKGTNVIFTNFGIHRDPKYFPHPDKFDPERFNDENKQNIVPNTYTPFGNGPRNCIGKQNGVCLCLLNSMSLFFCL